MRTDENIVWSATLINPGIGDRRLLGQSCDVEEQLFHVIGWDLLERVPGRAVGGVEVVDPRHLARFEERMVLQDVACSETRVAQSPQTRSEPAVRIASTRSLVE